MNRPSDLTLVRVVRARTDRRTAKGRRGPFQTSAGTRRKHFCAPGDTNAETRSRVSAAVQGPSRKADRPDGRILPIRFSSNRADPTSATTCGIFLWLVEPRGATSNFESCLFQLWHRRLVWRHARARRLAALRNVEQSVVQQCPEALHFTHSSSPVCSAD